MTSPTIEDPTTEKVEKRAALGTVKYSYFTNEFHPPYIQCFATCSNFPKLYLNISIKSLSEEEAKQIWPKHANRILMDILKLREGI